MQLVAYGAQDIYLTGNPQITFFKVVYRRHTNFSVESVEQTFNGDIDFSQTLTSKISRRGDLIMNMYLELELTQVSASNVGNIWWTNGLGHALIKTVEIKIGGVTIDKHYGEWMDIWNELTLPEGQRSYYDKMVGNYNSETGLKHNNNETKRYYIPLQFWFCRNPGLALPIIALQYHDLEFIIEFNDKYSLIRNDGNAFSSGESGGVLSGKLYVDYVYLDTDERRRFAQVSHEYLIEQVQFNNNDPIAVSKATHNATINFNHPIKALFWVITSNANTVKNTKTGNKLLTYSTTLANQEEDETFATAKLQLNGHDRFPIRNADYFRLVQSYQHHTNCPRKHIYSYSFALKPDDHQPSGTCNFSRIDSSVLQFTLNQNIPNSVLKVFAMNYNVLRIMGGMGALAYSN